MTCTPRALAAAVQAAASPAEARRLLDEAPPAIADIARTHLNIARAWRRHREETEPRRNFPAYRR